MTSLLWSTLGAKTFLKSNTKYSNLAINIFTRKIHSTKVFVTPSSFSKCIPKNVAIRVPVPYFKRGLATITNIDSENINHGLATSVSTNDTNNNKAVQPESIEKSVEAEEIIKKKRDYYFENYRDKTNFELLEDFPAWLEGLGMKAVAPLFEGEDWLDISRGSESIISVEAVDNAGFDVTADLECLLHSFDDGLGDFAPFFEGRELQEIKRMNDEDLIKMGIKSAVKRKKLIEGFNSLVDAIYEKNRTYYNVNYVEETNLELLEDFPAWLSGLGLKSLAPYFEGKSWQEIIRLRERDLDEIGISNVNHKRRLIRHFQKVQENLPEQESNFSLDNSEENNDKTEDKGIENFKVDPKIREDLPCWLNSLGDGFGDYAPYLEGKEWYEIIDLGKPDLNELGIKDAKIKNKLTMGFSFYKRALKNNEAEEAVSRIHIYQKENYITKTNFELLEDFPAWLDGLGMKVLASRFEGRAWQDIIKMDCSDLEKLGVPTKGLRMKLVKHFMRVEHNMNEDSSPEEDKTERMKDSENFVVDYEVMEDLTCWLHSICDEVGKFGPFFNGKKWQEVIDMNHKDLLELGIRHRRMRRMLLEGFEIYKKAMATENQCEHEMTDTDPIPDSEKGKEVSATL
ncbi:3996_t:CDS:10 [Acaulospora morrowiae]|uniref:3996_t:CDS:1 n=1 Tax=Acaulospora morrowiae TaxID=94023 RepID=A0A9N9BCL5_9GLOM|nr:3996_t:CDS:10 [Acaulospora morrowiae]